MCKYCNTIDLMIFIFFLNGIHFGGGNGRGGLALGIVGYLG